MTPSQVTLKPLSANNTNTTMTRQHPGVKFMELDQPGKDLLNKLVSTEIDEIEWPENHTPRFQPKKATKHTRVTYDKRTERYVSVDSTQLVPEVNFIKIDLGNNALHYCYHPIEKTYIRIQPPKDFQAKFIAITSGHT